MCLFIMEKYVTIEWQLYPTKDHNQSYPFKLFSLTKITYIFNNKENIKWWEKDITKYIIQWSLLWLFDNFMNYVSQKNISKKQRHSILMVK